MYEAYLSNANALYSIEINIDEETYWNPTSTTNNNDETPEAVEVDNSAYTITFTFAVRTDELAWLTIDGNGCVYPAFGGTGISTAELHTYAEQAVTIWRAITGNTDTTCQFEPADTPNADVTYTIDA